MLLMIDDIGGKQHHKKKGKDMIITKHDSHMCSVMMRKREKVIGKFACW